MILAVASSCRPGRGNRLSLQFSENVVRNLFQIPGDLIQVAAEVNSGGRPRRAEVLRPADPGQRRFSRATEFDLGGIAADFGALIPHLFEQPGDVLDRYRQIPVAVARGAADRGGRDAAYMYGYPALLDGLREGPHRAELDVLAL